MDYYDINALINHNAVNGVMIAPNNRQEWVKYCWALKTLNYPQNFFVAVSFPDAKAAKVWNDQRRFNLTEEGAKGIIVALSKEAGVDISQFRQTTHQRQAYRSTAAGDFDGIDIPETPQQPPLKIELEEVARREEKAEQSALFNFLCRLFPSNEVARVFHLYRVGATTEFKTAAPALASAFPYLNASGDCVDIHLMPYDQDGHRWKSGYSQNWLMAKRKQSDRRAPWCLFGEHLLRLNPSAPVGVVESEKTALIAALAAPGYVWTATASLQNLNPRRCAGIRNRDIYIFPDADGLEQWRAKAEALRKEGFNVFFCGEYITAHATAPKDDLGDIICRWLENRGGVEV